MTLTRNGRKIDFRIAIGNIASLFILLTSLIIVLHKIVFAQPLNDDRLVEPKKALSMSRADYAKMVIREEILTHTNSESKAIELSEKIVSVANDFELDPFLLSALIQTESGFDQSKISNVGAKGLGQLTDICVEELARHNVCVDLSDPDSNLRGTAQYLKMMLERFDGDEVLAIAAYNAGPSIVEKVGIPDFGETRTHVQRVMERRNLLWY